MRVSATWLDGFLLYKTTDWKQLDELVASIKREPFPESDVLLLGKAFHAVAEGLGKPEGEGERSAYVYGNYAFDAESVDRALSLLPVAVREVKDQRDVMTRHGPVTLSCVADGMHGFMVSEIKTSMKALDPAKYAAAYQWRVYMLTFGAQIVNYLLVKLSKHKDIWFADADTLPLYWYPALHDDVATLTADFIDFCSDQNLLGYLEA